MTENIKCVGCGNPELVPIQYGFPTPTLIERAKREEIALGGTYNHGYTHYCYKCHETFPATEYPT